MRTGRFNGFHRRCLFTVFFFIAIAGIFALFVSFHYRGRNRSVYLRDNIYSHGRESLEHFYVHQIAKDINLPHPISKWSSSWSTCFKYAHYVLWTETESRQFIMNYYPWFLHQYDSMPDDSQRANVARYFFLFHYGGIFADIASECIRPFRSLLLPYRIVFGAMDGSFEALQLPEGYVQNSFIYSRPRESFWLEVIYRIARTNFTKPPELSKGSNALMKSIIEYRRRFSADQSGLKIYPPSYFNPISWITKNMPKCSDYRNLNVEQLESCKQSLVKTSYVIQYHIPLP